MRYGPPPEFGRRRRLPSDRLLVVDVDVDVELDLGIGRQRPDERVGASG